MAHTKKKEMDQKINASRAQLEQCVSLMRNLAYLSDYFFITSGKDALKPARETAVSVLPQVIIEAMQFYQVAADTKRLRLELDESKIQYKLEIRPELIRQVFMNIFDNWLKYGVPDQIIHVMPQVNKRDELVIEINGKSIGFDNNKSTNLFELGYRAPQASEKVAQGSGIGLYICKEIIEKTLRGRISAVHQQTNQETKFQIFIPKEKWRT